MTDDRCGWVECQQGTPEWIEARKGKITASKFGDIRSKGTHGDQFLKGAEAYARELVIERLTNKVTPDSDFKQTKWGNANENGARATYTMRTGRGIDQVGFATHLNMPMVGCSVDGLIGHDGTAEIKCPFNPTVHLHNLQTRAVPGEYRAQIQGGLWITAREWCDFVSYDPRYPDAAERFQLVTVRVHRSEDFIADLARRVSLFSEHIEEIMAEVQKSAEVQERMEHDGI